MPTLAAYYAEDVMYTAYGLLLVQDVDAFEKSLDENIVPSEKILNTGKDGAGYQVPPDWLLSGTDYRGVRQWIRIRGSFLETTDPDPDSTQIYYFTLKKMYSIFTPDLGIL